MLTEWENQMRNDGDKIAAEVIAHLSFSGDFGGREKVVAQLVKGFQAVGIKTYLYLIIENRAGNKRLERLYKSLQIESLEYRRFETHRRLSISLLKEICRRLHRDSVKIAHCHCYKSLFYMHISRLLGLWQGQVYFTLHGLIVGNSINDQMIKTCQYLGIRLCDGVIGCSKEVLESTMNGDLKEKSTTIINGISVKETDFQHLIEKKRASKKKILAKYHLSENSLLIINVGRLTAQKNFPLYLQLVEQRTQLPNHEKCRFLVVGDGELRESLKGQVQTRGIENNVIFTGFVADMDEMYLGADILIQTSIWEGTPMCLLEARSLGLPVIASNVGGNSDIITDGENGFLVESGNVEQFIGALGHYMDDEKLRLDHGRKGYEDTLRSFGVKKWVSNHLEFYQHICGHTA
ncbi:MAG: glycosyltransferase family 1 protein [Desulfobulbaceae bacterium]|nr:MAG: glycosyltransferase family 1 protein [Desulfobulbaceae bacterium]